MSIADELQPGACLGSPQRGVVGVAGKRRLTEFTLAIALLLAASLKVHQVFTSSTDQLIGLLHDRFAILALVQAEFLLGYWLIVGGWRFARFWTSLAAFGLFGIVAIYEAAHAMKSCGCLGNVKVPPIVTAIFDGISVVALWLGRPRNPSEAERQSRKAMAIGATLTLATSIAMWSMYLTKRASAHDHTTRADNLIILDPSSWLNQTFPLLDEIIDGGSLQKGRWLVVFYHFDCDTCRQAIPAYLSHLDELTVNGARMAFVQMPPDPPADQDLVAPSRDYLHLKLRPDRDWFATTPVVVAVEDGKVIWAKDGEDAAEPPHIAW